MLCSSYPAIFILLLQIGYINGLTRWPDGNYGLLKPKTGCPKEWEGKDWADQWGPRRHQTDRVYKGWTDKAYIFQFKEGIHPNNNSSEILNIKGYVDSRLVLRYFCVKDVKQSSIKWPKGSYCIYQNEQQRTGWIKHQMYYAGCKHSSEHVNDFATPYYRTTMTFYFHCKTNGKKPRPISLPITKPFYLLPYGSPDCQQVQWMVATSEWIKYDTDNYEGRHWYKDGKVPHHEVGKDQWNTGIKTYYCYYDLWVV